MVGHPVRKRSRRPSIEALECRAVPATFGVPWQDPSHLTLSFAPDGTAIAGHASSLFQTLNAQEPAADWQRQILRAFQTWAVQANINIGLVGDDGQPFGADGPSQHDPEFGDIRVGAQPMTPEALSVSVPNDPALSSTWTGDVLVNSNDSFGSNGLDLFSVLLHEAGHVFGLHDSSDPSSAMIANYNDGQQLSAADIATLRSLYGVRSLDPHEGSSGNDLISKATQVPFPGSYTGATPLVEYGDIGTNQDVDFYAVRPPSNYGGPITFQLQSAGISLLTTHLTVLDARGNVLGEAEAASDLGDTVTVHLDQSSPNATYYVKVQGDTSDVFGIGSYGLAVTFDATDRVTPSDLDAVLRGPYQALNPNDLATLLQDPGHVFFNGGQHGSDDFGSATRLTSTPGYAQNAHFTTLASLSDPADVDLYRIQPPNTQNGQSLVLTASVRAVLPNGAAPRVSILDGDGNAVSAQILANGDGVFTIQAAGLKSGGNYFLRVAGDGTPSGVGNYALDASFGSAAANLTTFAGGSLGTSSTPDFYHFYVGESQLFQYLLSASAGAPAGSAVEMVIMDQGGKVVYTLTASAGDTVSDRALFLSPGAYTLAFARLGAAGGSATPLAYNLTGEEISDPIGPTLDDPTTIPAYASPDTPGMYTYPGDISTTMPYWLMAWAQSPDVPPPPPLPPASAPPPFASQPSPPPASADPGTIPPISGSS